MAKRSLVEKVYDKHFKSVCNCDASCGENRYHTKGSKGCVYEVKTEAQKAIRGKTWFVIEKPNGSFLNGLNGAPLLFPTASSASRSGKTTRGNVVTPIKLTRVL